jgi:hypothetical protein
MLFCFVCLFVRDFFFVFVLVVVFVFYPLLLLRRLKLKVKARISTPVVTVISFGERFIGTYNDYMPSWLQQDFQTTNFFPLRRLSLPVLVLSKYTLYRYWNINLLLVFPMYTMSRKLNCFSFGSLCRWKCFDFTIDTV